MSISARCQDCKKVYSLGDHQAGKRFRCKACGGVVVAPAAPGSSAPAIKPPTRTAASSPAKRPARASSASDDPFNNMDALLSLESSGTVQDAPPPAAVTPRRGSAPQQVAPAPAPYRAPTPAKPLQYAGPRRGGKGGIVNDPDESFVIDKLVPGILIGLGWGIPLVVGIVGAVMGPRPVGALIQLVIQQGLLFSVMVPIITKGVEIGANSAQFSMTANPRIKVFAVYCGMVLIGAIVVIVMLVAGAAAASSGSRGNFSVQSLIRYGLSALGIAFAASLGVGYVIFKFLFHCTWAQALMGFLIYVVFLILAFIAMFIVAFGLALLLGGVLGLGAG